MKKLYDKRGIPIQDGDVLKVFHFTGARNKKYYMYKIAWTYMWSEGSRMMAAHASGIAKDGCSIKNSYALDYNEKNGILYNTEIVEGYDENHTHFEERERITPPERSENDLPTLP